jgi:S1-C subfamily serine protease
MDVGSPRRIAALLVAAATLACGCAGSGSPSSTASADRNASTRSTTSSTSGGRSGLGSGDAAEAIQDRFVQVVKTIRPSVVEISTPDAIGSGVVLDRDGAIVTNAHVVAGATDFTVTFADGSSRPAHLVGAFTPEDLAVVRVRDASGLTPATFADSSKLEVGDMVMAVGNPLGLATSVTSGIVSFAGRTVDEGNGVILPDTVQTSAPINPGNSGGALVDLDGEVVGIPTLAASDPQLGGTAPGIGFAIASNRVTRIARQLADSGRVTDSGRAALGIRALDALDPSGRPAGVIIAGVTAGGPAARAGIRAGDRLVELGDRTIASLSDLQDELASLAPDQQRKVTVVRGGDEVHLTVKLGTLTA